MSMIVIVCDLHMSGTHDAVTFVIDLMSKYGVGRTILIDTNYHCRR
jgi:hypothetical protein